MLYPTPRVPALFLSVAKPSRIAGVTLIELLTSLSIIMILTSFSVGTMPDLVQRKVESTAFDTLFRMVTFARQRAIREQEIFTICASDDGINCSGQWNRKIIIFNDNNRNARRDSGEDLYKDLTMRESTPCIRWSSGLDRSYLRFKPDGTNAGTAGHFRFCNPEETHIKKKLVVSFTGRTSIKNL